MLLINDDRMTSHQKHRESFILISRRLRVIFRCLILSADILTVVIQTPSDEFL
jgi:uncharacterized membrane protein